VSAMRWVNAFSAAFDAVLREPVVELAMALLR
jgi:hypothetical protein